MLDPYISYELNILSREEINKQIKKKGSKSDHDNE
jgi:hypothetical protein